MKASQIAMLAAVALGSVYAIASRKTGPVASAPGTYRFRVTYPQTMSLPAAAEKQKSLAFIPGMTIVSQNSRTVVYDLQTSSPVHFQARSVADDGTVTEMIPVP